MSILPKQFIEICSRIHAFYIYKWSSYLIFCSKLSEAKAVVIGPTDIYVKFGSEVILTCIVSQGPHELGTIYWYRGKCTMKFDLYINSLLIKNPLKITEIANFLLMWMLCQLDSTMLDVPAEFQSNDIEYSPRITVDTKWTDALRSR